MIDRMCPYTWLHASLWLIACVLMLDRIHFTLGGVYIPRFQGARGREEEALAARADK